MTNRTWSLRIRFVGVLLAGLAPILAYSTEARAQSQGARPIFVAIPEAFPDMDARALLVRDRGRDIVVLNGEEATTDVLAMSLSVLARVRERHPTGDRGQLVPIIGFSMRRAPSGDHLRRLVGTLRRLDSAPTTTVGNLGRGRWVRLAPR